MKKKRLDVLLVEKNLVSSREKAKALILSGEVLVNNQIKTKCGEKFLETDLITLKSKFPYVSRGGIKLDFALKEFKIDIKNKICLDIGSSTGGFTEVLLQNGAKKVYAIDVGTNQLAYSLRTDNRVVVMENTNVKNIKKEDFDDIIDFAVIDVSFISLKSVFKPVYEVLEKKEIVALVKPQFEVGDIVKNFDGVVKKSSDRLIALERVKSYAKENNLFIEKVCLSPIKGPKGNIEFFLYLTDKENDIYFSEIIKKSEEFFK